MIALGLLLLWTSRHQIARALRAVGGGRREAGDDLPYRWVMLGLLLSVGYLVLFCGRAGMRPGPALVLVGLIPAAHLVWARLRAENGMAFIEFPLPGDSLMLEPFGNGSYRLAEVVTALAVRWHQSPGWGESCEVITGSSMDALKISDAGRVRRKIPAAARGNRQDAQPGLPRSASSRDAHFLSEPVDVSCRHRAGRYWRHQPAQPTAAGLSS